VAGVARFSGLYSELCLWLEEADNGCRCRAEIEECEDADASKMQARPNFVPIDQLPSFIGKKARTTSVADMPLTPRGSTCCIGVAPTYKYCTPARLQPWPRSRMFSNRRPHQAQHMHALKSAAQRSVHWMALSDSACCLHQALVDLLGVVTTVGPLGSVKRKSDQSELQRRDITLLDSR
jgi:Replication protein A OB domain